MALTLRALKLLAPYLKDAKVLSLGYPDLIAPDLSFLGVSPSIFTDYGNWHGVDYGLPETMHVFELLGSTLDCVDIHASRGCERIVDLNCPQALGEYDLVIDAGTIEHCFHIGQALNNAAGAVKAGGRIFHSPPMSMGNHGFYNLNPTLFFDFYTQNGWVLENLSGVNKTQHGPVPSTKRFTLPPEASLHVLARRTHGEPFRTPMQSKYLENPELK